MPPSTREGQARKLRGPPSEETRQRISTSKRVASIARERARSLGTGSGVESFFGRAADSTSAGAAAAGPSSADQTMGSVDDEAQRGDRGGAPSAVDAGDTDNIDGFDDICHQCEDDNMSEEEEEEEEEECQSVMGEYLRIVHERLVVELGRERRQLL